MNKKIIIITITIALLIILGASGYLIWLNFKTTQMKNPTMPVSELSQQAIQGVLPSINTNPLENKPDLNPADKANPFKNVETNPFK